MPNSEQLKGKVALVTGASREIGGTIARELAARGAAVAVNYRSSADAAAEVVSSIREAGGRAVAVAGDVTDAGQTDAVLAQTEQQLGPVDILVLNTTGYSSHLRGPFLGMKVDELVDNMAAQARAALRPVAAVAPGMAERGSGAIVFISDSFARTQLVGTIGHGLTKAPVESAMKHLALELGPKGVRVNTVIPGATRSPNLLVSAGDQHAGKLEPVIQATPLRKIGEPQDVANAVAFLAGPESTHMTGAFLPVSGGFLLL
ncbi:SDR family NAD(P)-dependent oxidoreductase [Streptomyces sp. NBC_00986]|uniref:SDR family NAD(P)-dependent oxidoreductase n=1 Tax=Streptomyces sp. NBC_00986 TaxID=2903702 RepID=UPI00386D1938|nr:SDR family oxidoreductase [Streptomyces sp. NBC_00986]WSX64495.1 SDR family oxidoreductase [Streptomyces sp. NBC_00986]